MSLNHNFKCILVYGVEKPSMNPASLTRTDPGQSSVSVSRQEPCYSFEEARQYSVGEGLAELGCRRGVAGLE